jgi:hypothetical protein
VIKTVQCFGRHYRACMHAMLWVSLTCITRCMQKRGLNSGVLLGSEQDDSLILTPDWSFYYSTSWSFWFSKTIRVTELPTYVHSTNCMQCVKCHKTCIAFGAEVRVKFRSTQQRQPLSCSCTISFWNLNKSIIRSSQGIQRSYHANYSSGTTKLKVVFWLLSAYVFYLFWMHLWYILKSQKKCK